jgi:hypothetical protein
MLRLLKAKRVWVGKAKGKAGRGRDVTPNRAGVLGGHNMSNSLRRMMWCGEHTLPCRVSLGEGALP